MSDWETEFTENFFRNRDVKDKEKDTFFIFDFEKDNISPFMFINMDKAIDRIKKAIDLKEKILVYTDYDCDGIPAATIFTDFFNKINYKNFEVYIPHRHLEGYGLHKKALERFVCNGYKLVITADLGITNIEEVKYLKEQNVDVILSDHHLPVVLNGVEMLPDTEYLINPNISHEIYPNKYLCGAGVAWKIVHAFLVKYRSEYGVVEGWEKWLLDLVAIALVADMMQLRGENRKLVSFGLKVLQKSPRPGLQKICQLVKLEQKDINEKDIAFTFAPRINAASRMDHPIVAYKMLANIDGKGREQAEYLEELNAKRKKSVKDINDYIKDIKLEEGDRSPILIGDKAWPVGVVGLVAQKIVEDTGRTALVYGVEGDVARGSVRSGVENHNVVNLLAACKECLMHFGGHEQAGGFALNIKDIDSFKELLSEHAGKFINVINKKEEKIDMTIGVEKVNEQTYKIINKFAPFGIGNETPKLKLLGSVLNSKRFGEGSKHLELNINGVRSVLFNISQETEKTLLSQGHFVGCIEYDNWRKRYQFKINL